jgi:hypothetical protein
MNPQIIFDEKKELEKVYIRLRERFEYGRLSYEDKEEGGAVIIFEEAFHIRIEWTLTPYFVLIPCDEAGAPQNHLKMAFALSCNLFFFLEIWSSTQSLQLNNQKPKP